MPSKLIITIPHYNNPKGLLKSVLSINETISIDIIIVDDGSRYQINEKELKDKYKNGEIFFKYLSSNQGVGVAANTCLQFAQKSKYEFRK